MPERFPIISTRHHDTHAYFSYGCSPFADSDEPVIALPDPEELCHWAAYECYMVKDAETLDAAAAATELALFEQRFGSRPSLHDMARWADSPPRVRHAHLF